MLNLLLTRHGQAIVGDVMLGGQLDPPLTDVGRREAETLARRLAGVRVDRIVSSPMQRALQTAQAIAAGRPVEIDERLRELDYGRWEALSYAEIDVRDPALRARWENDPAGTHSPGGESGEDVARRVRGFLVDMLGAELGEPAERDGRRSPDAGGSRGAVSELQAEAEGERRVLVVAHGTLNRIMLCLAMGIPVRDYRRRFIQDRTNLSVLRYERGDAIDEAQLVLANDVAHLRSPGEAPWG